jgi:hypothetical protein
MNHNLAVETWHCHVSNAGAKMRSLQAFQAAFLPKGRDAAMPRLYAMGFLSILPVAHPATAPVA